MQAQNDKRSFLHYENWMSMEIVAERFSKMENSVQFLPPNENKRGLGANKRPFSEKITRFHGQERNADIWFDRFAKREDNWQRRMPRR